MHKDCLDYFQKNLNAALPTSSQKPNIHFPSSEKSSTHKKIYPVTHLGLIEVRGKDAATFLQGQVTCNIPEVTLKTSRFAALCNPKGRVISPLLILKSFINPDSFFLLLPFDLTEKVIQHLSIFILRADVQLQNRSDDYCLTGLNLVASSLPAINLPQKPFDTLNEELTFLHLPGKNHRYLVLATSGQTQQLWQSSLASGFSAADSTLWRFLDISAGLPWFPAQQSAKYIPQMLNIDKLNGISFNKGCYTGQEIVARTHYLGKNKREMFLAECEKTTKLNSEAVDVIESSTREPVGKILCFQCDENRCRCLLIMPPEYSQSASLSLASENPAPLTIIPFE
jgi:folate-binding protein YgfZ